MGFRNLFLTGQEVTCWEIAVLAFFLGTYF